MKKFLLLSFLAITVLFTSNCGEEEDDPPVAKFSMDKSTARVGETVTFTNLSLNYGAFGWDFGDGTEEFINRNPTHSYSSVGTFTIELWVVKKADSDSNKGIDTASKTIVITP